MGRGDIRSRKGKIFAGSFGNRRKRGRRVRKTAAAARR
jgi:ribosomal small subunit protein bTHX